MKHFALQESSLPIFTQQVAVRVLLKLLYITVTADNMTICTSNADSSITDSILFLFFNKSKVMFFIRNFFRFHRESDESHYSEGYFNLEKTLM